MPSFTEPNVDRIFSASGDSAGDGYSIEPIYAKDKLTDKKNDFEALRKWITENFDTLQMPTALRTEVQIKNLALWLSLHYQSQSIASGSFRDKRGNDVTIDSHRVIVNNIYDIERNRYSKITRNQPQTRTVPTSTDYDDFVGSRISNAVLKTAKRNCRQKQLINQMVRESFIFGESWIRTTWDKDKGKVDPRWQKHVDMLEPGENSRKFLIDGEEMTIHRDKPLFVGDHDMKVLLPWELMVDPKTNPQDVEWIVTVDLVHVEQLKKEYPKKASDIRVADESLKTLNMDTLAVENAKDHCRVFTLWGRSTRFVPDGVYFRCTPDLTLEGVQKNPYELCPESDWGNLPFERLTDIDVPGRLYGFSTIQILSNLQHSENQMMTMVKHALLMLGHSKIAIPREAKVQIEEMSDGSYYLHYSGGLAPSVFAPNPVPPQVVQFAEYCRDKMQKLGDLHGVSSGDLPNSVRAAKAIRLLQEMEDLRATSIFGKYNELYLALDRKLLLQTKNYRKSDGRLSFMLGKGNEHLVEDFDPEEITENVQVELEFVGMLPQQPSARAEFLTEMFQQTQGQLFTREKWVKLMGFESEQEFIDSATVSVIKAQRENDRIIKSRNVDAPAPHENHIVEITEHATLLQSVEFQRLPEKQKEVLLRHVRTHEFLVYRHMQVNPVYKEFVFTTCPWFPMVFKLPLDTMAQMGSPGAVQMRPQGNQQAQVAQQPQPGAAAPQQPQQQAAG